MPAQCAKGRSKVAPSASRAAPCAGTCCAMQK
ncbi:hypothetical protein A2U01_0057409, partial [Trifolium medium]|nr:hypothetical protein [Trifolium medium]